MRLKISEPILGISSFNHSFVESNDTKKMLRHFISSDQKNAYNQVLDPEKYNDERYRKNPMVLYMHGDLGFFGQRSMKDDIRLSIAKNERLYIEPSNGVKYHGAETQFDEGNPEAMDIYRMYAKGFMNGWSKHFFPIDKPEFDTETNTLLYGAYGQYEYSSVKIGADGFAFGSDTYENALELVKTPMMKHSLFGAAMEGTIKNDFDNSPFKAQLLELKNRLDAFDELKNKIESIEPGMTKEDFKNEINSILNAYTNTLLPKVKELTNKQQTKLNDLTRQMNEVETTAKNAAVEVITEFMGAAK
jgi:hypothetical protein